MEPFSTTAVAAVTGEAALAAETAANITLAASSSAEGLAAAFGIKTLPGIKWGELGIKVMEQVTRTSIWQVAGQLGEDNEALSFASRAVAAYACSAVDFTSDKIKDGAEKFDKLVNAADPASSGLFDQIKDAVEKLGEAIKNSPLAKAVAYAGISEAGKYSGNEAAAFVAPAVLKGLTAVASRIKDIKDKMDMQ